MTVPNRASTWADRLLDKSILFSFDRSGFERHQRRFGSSDPEVDMTGKICLVTGANGGLGRATSEGLAARGATVLLACRNRELGERAQRQIRAATGNSSVETVEVDLSLGRSVDDFVERLPHERIDVLVNNAAVLLSERQETGEGLETTLATNLLGPARLTEALIGRLQRSDDPRVINVSSGGMYPVRLALDDPQWSNRPFDGVRAYAETKRALVVLTEMWSRAYAETGILFHSMHPGWADTAGVRRSLPGFWRRMQRRLRTAEQGADTILWLAFVSPDRLGSGRFWFDRRPVSTHLLPWTRESESERRRLWQLCRELQAATISQEVAA